MCPGTNMVNQIDHVVKNKRHASSTTDVKSLCGSSCDTDHFLVEVILRERLSNALKNQGRKRKRWNIDKLKNEDDFKSSCLYLVSMMIKTLYYPTDAQIYNL